MGVRSIARNAGLNLLGQAIPLAVGAVAIPLAMRWLGPTRFGALALVWVLIAYLSVFDLGLGRATTRFVAEANERDESEIPSLVGTALAAQALLGIAGAALLWIAIPVAVQNLLSVPPALSDEIRDAFRVVAAALPLLLVSTSVRGVLEAAQRFDMVNVFKAPAGAASFLMPLLGATAGWTLPAIVASIVAVQAMATAAQLAACLRVYPSLRRPRVAVGSIRKLLRFGGWVAVSGVAGPILVYVDRFAIAALVSVAAAGHYAAPYELVTRLSIIPISLAVALFPVFSATRFDPDGHAALAARSVRTLLLTVGPIAVIVIGLSGDIARLWLGGGLERTLAVPLRILAVGALVNALACVPYALLQGIGRPDLTGKIHLAELPVHLALVWLLVGAFGLTGAALAWTIRSAIDAVLLFLTAARLGAIPLRSLRMHGAGLSARIALAGAVALALSAVPSFPARVAGVLATATAAALATLPAERRDRSATALATASPSS